MEIKFSGAHAIDATPNSLVDFHTAPNVNSSNTHSDASSQAIWQRARPHCVSSSIRDDRSSSSTAAASSRAAASSSPNLSRKSFVTVAFISQSGSRVATLPSSTPLKTRRRTVVFPEPLGPWTTPMDHAPLIFDAGKSGGANLQSPSNSKSNAADAALAQASTLTWHL